MSDSHDLYRKHRPGCIIFYASQPLPDSFRIWAFDQVVYEKAGDTITFVRPAASPGWKMDPEEWTPICRGMEVQPSIPPTGAGWFKMEIRDDGLYAADVRWTDVHRSSAAVVGLLLAPTIQYSREKPHVVERLINLAPEVGIPPAVQLRGKGPTDG